MSGSSQTEHSDLLFFFRVNVAFKQFDIKPDVDVVLFTKLGGRVEFIWQSSGIVTLVHCKSKADINTHLDN